MRAYDHILTKQVEWARNQGIDLIGSQGERGRPAYTTTLDANLFQPLLPDIRSAFEDGDGKELGDGRVPGKMQAVHSSSALGVNVFQYWHSIADPATIAAACGLCKAGSTAPISIEFERKWPVHPSFPLAPNIDVVIRTQNSAIRALAIECKFSEAYGSHGHSGLKPRYLSECDDLWRDIPSLREFAETISPDDTSFEHLHPAQLVKHALGLKRAYGRTGFRLLYLWYDAPRPEGYRHREECERFGAIAKRDGIHFHSMSYQELIARLARDARDKHAAYVGYLTERYL